MKDLILAFAIMSIALAANGQSGQTPQMPALSPERIARMEKAIKDAEKTNPVLAKQLQSTLDILRGGKMPTVAPGGSAPVARQAGAVSKKVLSDVELLLHLQHAVAEQERIMDPALVADAKKVYGKVHGRLLPETAYGANHLWVFGRNQTAIWMMGKACIDDPSDPDNLNNFASFLTMADMPDLAIPILIKLNASYPSNSTVLNNLGQAWLSLKDGVTAEPYLDSAIRLFPGHAQANAAKSVIEEVRGDRAAAIESMKTSIRSSYSPDKEARLKKLGYEVGQEDVCGSSNHAPDGLGLGNIRMPGFYHNWGEQLAGEVQWEDFLQAVQSKIDGIEKQRMDLEPLIKEEQMRIPGIVGSLASHPENKWLMQPPGFTHANKALALLNSEKGGFNIMTLKQLETEGEKLEVRLDMREKQFEKEVEDILKSFSGGGEGKEIGDMDRKRCEALRAAANRYLDDVSTWKENWVGRYLRASRTMVNEQSYWGMRAFLGEATCLDYELGWLHDYYLHLHAMAPIRVDPDLIACKTEEDKTHRQHLVDWEELHCDEIVLDGNMGIYDFGKATFKCSKVEVTGNLVFGEYRYTENLNTGAWTGEVQIGASYGIKQLKKVMGPIKAEAKIKGAGYMSWSNGTLTDYGVIIGAAAGIGPDMGKGDYKDTFKVPGTDLSGKGLNAFIEAKGEARWSWNTDDTFSRESVTKEIKVSSVGKKLVNLK